MRIAVCVKQVPDPDIPQSQFKVDEGSLSVVPPTGVPPVVNGFDLNAAEAAIQIAEADTTSASEITIISAGHSFHDGRDEKAARHGRTPACPR